MKITHRLLLLLLIAVTISACEYTFGENNLEEESAFSEMNVNQDFDYKTIKTVDLYFPENHIDHDALIYQVTNEDTTLLGVFPLEGQTMQLPVDITTEFILTTPLGITGSGNYVFGITGQEEESDNTLSKVNQTYYPMGTWNYQGVPDYLESQRDQVSEELLLNIDATLPESRPVPNYNPEYLNGLDMNTLLVDNADVWVTFVHEGAGYRNVLGYFSYQEGAKPTSIDEVDSLKIIFPNVSFRFSGGGLRTGDKVYLGRFEEGTVISWFLIPDGWIRSWGGGIKQNVNGIKYAINDFNDFTSEQYRQHTIVLNNASEELLLLSFEDISRPGGDNDFNDAIFYVTANPYTAIETSNLVQTKVAQDSDGDGIFDHQDEFPNDPERAYYSYWPGQNKFATVLFEDRWPSIGDYDFNDLVMDYRLTFIKSADGSVKEVKINTVTKAVGGRMSSALLFNLGLDQANVESVTGNRLENNFIQLNANGTEQGNSDAVIPIFDDSRQILPPPAGFLVTNVYDDQPHVDHVNMTTSVIFTTPVAQNSINYYDPFIVTDYNRGQEIHLPGQDPTEKADMSLFGSIDDASNFNLGFTYKNSDGLPWALHVMQSIKYPMENRDFSTAYSNFRNWAESGGVTHTDWFKQRSDNMNSAIMYNPN